LGFGVSFSELVLAVPAVLLALRRASGDATHKAIFFYGTRLREQCEQDPAFGYELMKRTAEVVIKRLGFFAPIDARNSTVTLANSSDVGRRRPARTNNSSACLARRGGVLLSFPRVGGFAGKDPLAVVWNSFLTLRILQP